MRSMLTAKQEQFVQSIIQGKSQADAYRSAYNTVRMSDNAVYREASLLMANPKITKRLLEITSKVDQEKVLNAQQRLEWLSDVINGTVEDADIYAKLKAVDIMNKMQGQYVQKIEGSLSVAKLEDLI